MFSNMNNDDTKMTKGEGEVADKLKQRFRFDATSRVEITRRAVDDILLVFYIKRRLGQEADSPTNL